MSSRELVNRNHTNAKKKSISQLWWITSSTSGGNL